MASYPPTAYFLDTEVIEPHESYQHGMFWTTDADGTDPNAEAYFTGARIYAIGRPGRPLAVDEVSFTTWYPPDSADLSIVTMIAPEPSSGVPAAGTWRFTLEVFVNDVWQDITEYCQSIDHDTGTSRFGSHKSAGVTLIDLESDDHRFAPWTVAGEHMRKGTPVRGSLHLGPGTAWFPIFTGEIDDNVEYSTTLDEIITASVTVLDTASARLAQVQLANYDFTSTQLLTALVYDLLTEAAWPYGSVVDVPTVPGRPSGEQAQIGANTVLVGTVLEVLRRYADAWALAVRADRFGRVWFTRRRPDVGGFAGGHPEQSDVAVVIDLDVADTEPTTIRFGHEDVINDLSIVDYDFGGITGPAYAGAGAEAVRQGQRLFEVGQRPQDGLRRGAAESQDTDDAPVLATEQATDAASIARYGPKAVKYTSPFTLGFVRWLYPTFVTKMVELLADDVWKIKNIRLDDREIDLIAQLDVGTATTVAYDRPAAHVEFAGHVARMRYRLTGLNKSELNLAVDVDVDANSKVDVP